jgi:hypothetical protein
MWVTAPAARSATAGSPTAARFLAIRDLSPHLGKLLPIGELEIIAKSFLWRQCLAQVLPSGDSACARQHINDLIFHSLSRVA